VEWGDQQKYQVFCSLNPTLQECGDIVYWDNPIPAYTWAILQLWSTLKLISAVIEMKHIGLLFLLVVLVSGSVHGRLTFYSSLDSCPSDRPVRS